MLPMYNKRVTSTGTFPLAFLFAPIGGLLWIKLKQKQALKRNA